MVVCADFVLKQDKFFSYSYFTKKISALMCVVVWF